MNIDSESKVTIGLVGCGRWGRLILRDLISIGCKVCVVARSSISIEGAISGGASAIYPDIAGLFRSEKNTEGVVIATRAHEHHGVIMELLRLLGPSFPIFCEKPITTDVRDADEVVRVGKKVFVMDKWRYHPAVRRMGRARETGEFGSLIGLHMRRVQTENPHSDVSSPWTYLPHDLSIVLEVFGNIPSVSRAVSACSDEAVFAILGNRPWAVVECSTRAVKKSREVTAHFGLATLSMSDPLSSTLRLKPSNGPEEEIVATGEMPLLAELRAFAGYLRGGPPPRSTAADGACVVKTIQDILFASNSS
jgi:predicted dehydrogenase